MAPAGVDAGAFLAGFAERLVELLLVDYLTAALPTVATVLEMCGVIRHEFQPETATRPSYVETRFRFAEIPELLTHPERIRERVYGWGTDDLDFDRLANHLLGLCFALDIPAARERVDRRTALGYQPRPEDTVKRMDQAIRIPLVAFEVGEEWVELAVRLLELPAEPPRRAGLILQLAIPREATADMDLGGDLRLQLRAAADLSTALGVVVRPGEVSVRFPFAPGTPPPSAGVGIALEYAPASARTLLGNPRSSRLEVAGARGQVALNYERGEPEFLLELSLRGLALALAAGDQDGFLARILGGQNVRVPIPLGLQWSSRRGLAFSGTSGFAVTVSPRLSLGPLRVDTVGVALSGPARPDGTAGLTLQATLSIAGPLGPVSFTVTELGVQFAVVFAPGNAGPFGIDVGFKPPDGMGLVVDAGPVTGGGFIRHDPAQGRYIGVLQLQVFGVAVSAVAILDTRLPGGTPAYSFLLLITAEFPPLQLGMGFTLNGLGGLAGLHRTVATEPIRASLREGSAERLLFPRDAVRNATRIVTDLSRFVPPAADRYVFGPMAKIGYGTPTIVEVDLGIVLELPEPFRIVLLGVLKASFPSRTAPVVRLNLDALGVLDFGAKTFALDASLYDSRVAGFELSGDMALRLAWGEQPVFALAVGGFNPHFSPPPAFPSLRRLALALGSGDNPRLALEAYFALTSNTLQFGAHAALHAAAAGFAIDGALGFDALIIFDPFGFRVDIAASLALTAAGMTLASVRIDGTLEGPRPWHVTGHAHVSILFIHVQVDVDARFGDPDRPAPPPELDPWEVLRPALEEVRNWAPSLPGTVVRAASFVRPPEDRPALLDPMGGVSVQQRVVPLGRRITKVGERRTAGPRTLAVTGVRIGGRDVPLAATRPVTAPFAAAQYEDLTEAEKLSRPSFEPMQAGLAVTEGVVTCGGAVGGDLTYETIVPGSGLRTGDYQPLQAAQLSALGHAAAATETTRLAGLGRYAPPPGQTARVALAEEDYVIASTAGLRVVPIAPPGRQGALEAALADYVAANPGARGTLHVVPATEAEAA